jgi:hypothetical protein
MLIPLIRENPQENLRLNLTSPDHAASVYKIN